MDTAIRLQVTEGIAHVPFRLSNPRYEDIPVAHTSLEELLISSNKRRMAVDQVSFSLSSIIFLLTSIKLLMVFSLG